MNKMEFQRKKQTQYENEEIRKMAKHFKLKVLPQPGITTIKQKNYI